MASLIDIPKTLFQSEAIDWKLVIISGIIFDFVFKTFLDARQYKAQCKDTPPAEVQEKKLVDEETFIKSQNYSKAKLKFTIFERVLSLVENVAIVHYDVLPKLYYFSAGISAKCMKNSEIFSSVILLLVLMISSSILSLPSSWYSTFIIEQRFGFNQQTTGLWIQDNLKSLGLTLVLLPPIAAAMIGIIRYCGSKFVVYLVGFILVINLVAMIVYPTLIAPLFNKYEPLEDGELKDAIFDLAGSLKFPLGKIYVVDGSTRSSHSNAYFVGMPWYKQIVLYDTLIKDHTKEEIVAVLAHELGHWRRNHILILLSVSMVSSTINFSLLGLFLNNQQFFKSLNFNSGDMPIAVALMVFMDALGPVAAIIQFGQNFIIRSCEYDADRFGVSLGHGDNLSKALTTLHKANLSTVDADGLYSTFHHSHPILPERLKAIDLAMKKKN